MATIHMNLDKIISEKIDAKLTEAVDKIIEKALSNIVIDNEPDDKNKFTEGDFSKKESVEEEEVKKKYPEFTDEYEDFKKGWVEKSNAYTYVINEMKRALTDDQMKWLATPNDMSAKEYAFKDYIDNLTWEQLHILFKNNEYFNIDIDSEDLNRKQLEAYGVTPKDIYYVLFKQIINNVIHKTIVFKQGYDYQNTLERLIVDEFNKDFDNRCIELTNNIINNYHIVIFDELFGENFYMKK